ncbi:MAG TPA: hypothetical protein EYG89_00405 [Bacteroidia bacterium]|nr:hypothetical protein [Bacteroidia bacterium]
MKTFLLLFIFTISNIYAQNIEGLIVDEENLPISEANIILSNTGIGTISNIQGKFTLRVPEKLASELIIFSYLGYESKEMNVTDLKQNNKIQLKRTTTELNEVFVEKKIKLTANEIITKAFNNYTKTFPTDAYITKGFLRYTEKTNKEYKWLIESTLDLYDPSITKTSDHIKLNVKEVRKSFDNRVLDTIKKYVLYLYGKGMPLRKAIRFSAYNELSKQELKKAIIYGDNKDYKKSTVYNNLKNIFSKANVLRNYNTKDAIFTEKTLLKKHTFKLDTILDYNGDDIYKIKITPKKSLVKLNKKLKKNLLPFGWIYVRATDFAIFEFDYTLVNSKRIQLYTNLTNSKIHSSFKIKFNEFNGEMYPKYLVYKKSKINRILDSFEAIDNKTNNTDIHYFSTLEVLFTEIITDKEKINTALQKKWDNNLFKPRQYHTDFWKDYNILLESKAQKNMRQDLEQKVKLKEQYQNN